MLKILLLEKFYGRYFQEGRVRMYLIYSFVKISIVLILVTSIRAEISFPPVQEFFDSCTDYLREEHSYLDKTREEIIAEEKKLREVKNTDNISSYSKMRAEDLCEDFIAEDKNRTCLGNKWNDFLKSRGVENASPFFNNIIKNDESSSILSKETFSDCETFIDAVLYIKENKTFSPVYRQCEIDPRSCALNKYIERNLKFIIGNFDDFFEKSQKHSAILKTIYMSKEKERESLSVAPLKEDVVTLEPKIENDKIRDIETKEKRIITKESIQTSIAQKVVNTVENISLLISIKFGLSIKVSYILTKITLGFVGLILILLLFFLYLRLKRE